MASFRGDLFYSLGIVHYVRLKSDTLLLLPVILVLLRLRKCNQISHVAALQTLNLPLFHSTDESSFLQIIHPSSPDQSSVAGLPLSCEPALDPGSRMVDMSRAGAQISPCLRCLC